MAAKKTEPAPAVGPVPPADAYPDLRVTVEFGATMPVLEYGNVKPLIRIEGLIPSGDVERQVQIALDTARVGFGAIDERFEQLISEIMSPATGKPGFSKRVGDLEDASVWTKRNLDKIAAKLREVDAAQKTIVAALDARQPASAPEVLLSVPQAEYDALRADEAQEVIGAHG